MSSSQNREEKLFEAAEALTVEQRAAYLKDACGDDLQLRQRIEQLLVAHDRGSDFMEESAVPAGAKCELQPVLFSEKPGDKIGRYKLLQQIGEGGCGVVYMAEQEEPVHRRVALKIIKLGMDTKNVIARFEAERQALALMDHPNIAKVFDAGATEKGRPFFVMELVQGTKLTKFCDENKMPVAERLKLSIAVCQAIQHAHQKGIIHRDIKPSNILVTLHDGVPVPKVIDFGIAKATTDQRLTDKTVFTAIEQFIGTPAYMSPEQAAMSDHGIDTRSDIYSLGVLLYELLTGLTPFDAQKLRQAGLDEIRRIIREEEPARPSTRLSTLPASNLMEIATARAAEPAKLSGLFRGELDWIVMKALEKDPNRRYDTAVDLAQDVERYLAKEPIVARPQGDFYRFKTMVRRNKLAFGSASAVICALVIGLGISLWEFVQKSRAEREQNHLRQEAQNAQASEARLRRHAQTQELDAREAAYSSDMNLVRQVLDEDNIGRARELLNRHRPKAGEQDLRGWEWRYFWGLCQSDAAFRLRTTDGAHIYTLSYSSDGSLLASGSDQQLLVWDLSTHKVIFRPPFKINFPCRAAFALKGDLLAYTEPTEVVIWNSRTRTEVRRLPVGAAIHDVRFTEDGRVFTTSNKAKDQIQFWDPATGQVLSSLSRPIPAFPLDTRCVITDDGKIFAGAGVGFGASDTVTFTDTANGTDLWHVRAADDFLTAIALSPVDEFVATGAGWMESTIKLWNRQTHQLVARLDGHRAAVCCLRFTPDGKTLVSASGDGTIRLWDIENRKLMRTLQGHTNGVWTVTVSPDGQKLASGSAGGEVLCWDLTSSLGHRHDYRWLTNGVDDWCFSSNGREIATYRTNHIQIHDAATLQVIDSPQLDVTNINSIAFSPDDRLLVVTADDGKLGVWDLEHRLTVTNFQAHPGVTWLCGSGFVNHGKNLVTLGGDQLAKEWDVATWRENRHWWVGTNIFAAALDPNTGLNVIATFSTNDVWVRKAELIRPGQAGPPKKFSTATLEALDLSLDGKVVAVADHGTITLWDTQTAGLVSGLRTEGAGAIALAFSPDRRLLAGSQNGKEAIKLWDLNSGYEVGALEAEGAYFSRVRWSSDGKSVGAINWHGTLCLWDALTWKQIADLESSPP